jgi:ribosomal protein S12 methylthiotransferase accessory factor
MEAVLDPLTGIVTGLRTIPLDHGSPSIFNASVRMADTSSYLGHKCFGRNGGAGLTEMDAWNAALGEAIERYCVSAVDPQRLHFGSWKELEKKSENPLHPAEIALFMDFQHESLGNSFTEDTALGWIGGRSLIDGRSRLVPACLIHIPYHPIRPHEPLIGPAISTGLACGASAEGALLSGLCECIERDAFSILWLNRLPATRLEIDEPSIREMFARRFRRPNMEYHIFWLSFDFSLPTVVVLIRDNNFNPPVVCFGGACRVDIRAAVVKALVESVQGWTWARYERLKHGEEPLPRSFEEIRDFDARVRLYACSDMSEALDFILQSTDCVPLSSLMREPRSNDEVLASITDELGKAKTDAIAIDLTTVEVASLGLRVMKSYCPRLQQVEGDHRYPLLGGSRWKEVPVACGYRKQPITREQLNAYPHPYP